MRLVSGIYERYSKVKSKDVERLFCGFLTFVRNDWRRVQADVTTTRHGEPFEVSAKVKYWIFACAGMT